MSNWSKLYPWVGPLLYALVTLPALLLNEVAVKQGDPIRYMKNALDLPNYESAYHPPLYSLLIAATNVYTSDIFLAGKLVSFLAGIALVLLTYQLGRYCLSDDRLALTASVLVALSPLSIQFGYMVGSDMLGAALFLGCGLLLVQTAIGKDARYVLAAGFVAGLAYLTRYVFAGIPIAATILFLFLPHGTLRSALRSIALFLGAFLLTVAPWSISCLIRYGDLHNMNHINLVFEMLDTTNSWLKWEEYEQRYPNLLSVIIAHPTEVVKHVIGNFIRLPLAFLLSQALIPGLLAIIGLVAIFRRPNLARFSLMLLSLTLLAMALLVKPDPRLFLWFLPVVIVFGVYVIEASVPLRLARVLPSSSALSRFIGAVPLRGVMVAVCLLVTLVVGVTRVPEDFRAANIADEKMAGEFIKARYPVDTRMLTSSMNLAWYADRDYVPITELGAIAPGDIAAAVQNFGVQLFIYSKRHSIYTHPQLQFLLDTADHRIPENWKPVYFRVEPSPIVVYEIGDRTSQLD